MARTRPIRTVDNCVAEDAAHTGAAGQAFPDHERGKIQRSPPDAAASILSDPSSHIAQQPPHASNEMLAMQAPEVDRPVRLLEDLPELGLRSGEVGVVCSTWFAPSLTYEVEFQPRGNATRALVTQDQIQPADDADARNN